MKPIISLDEWMKWYKWIISYMGFDYVRDRDSTILLARLLKNIEPRLDMLEELFKNNLVIVFGAGPSLPLHIRLLVENNLLINDNIVLVAADGASRALIENNIVPHVLVSDLDGGDDILSYIASHKNTFMLIHGHGDNVDKIVTLVPQFLEKTRRIIGTTQVEPVYPILNFGGFTDGDRAVFIATSFNPKAIILAGMDLGDVVGKYSKPWFSRDVKASVVKKKKLFIAKRLLEEVVLRRYRSIYSLSNTPIKGVNTIQVDQLGKLIS